jgi:hypothetical protein
MRSDAIRTASTEFLVVQTAFSNLVPRFVT